MYDDEEELKPTKQQRKRDAEAAQALGAELVKLSTEQLNTLVDKLDLPDKLHEALLTCRSIKSHEAHRRQLQYVGKLMRGIDLPPIQQQLAEIKRSGQVVAAQLHRIEHWRERLLSEGTTALDELLQQYPNTDAAQVQQLIARAQKESAHKQPPRAARLLFKYLRELIVM
jgi:ribosome-associated protein